jgi:hypothetical protein
MDREDIVAKYSSELRKYKNIVSRGLSQYLTENRRPFESTLNSLFDFYLFTSYLSDLKLFPDDQSLNPIKVLYSKAALSLLAIAHCLRNGIDSEASTLLRSIFETLLNVELILQNDTKERLKLFSDFQYIVEWNQLQSNRELLNKGIIDKDHFEQTFTEELIQQVGLNYDKVKSNYNPQYPYHWAWKIFKDELKRKNPSISFICEKLGKEYQWAYVKIYSTLSITVHSSPHIINAVSIGNSITMTPRFSQNISSISWLALYFCSKVVKRMVEYLNFQSADEIKTFIDSFVSDVDKMLRNDQNSR